MVQNDNCIKCNKIVKPKQHSITCDSNLSLLTQNKPFIYLTVVFKAPKTIKGFEQPKKTQVIVEDAIRSRAATYMYQSG